VEYLELPDKAKIISKDEVLRSGLGFRSVGDATRILKKVTDLRNNIAHSYESLSCDWVILVESAELVQRQLKSAERFHLL
jgi:hypothetical protein